MSSFIKIYLMQLTLSLHDGEDELIPTTAQSVENGNAANDQHWNRLDSASYI